MYLWNDLYLYKIKGNIFETEIRWAGDIKTEDLHISFDKADILEIRQMEVKDHIVSLSFRARKPGRVDVKLENKKANSINKEEYHLYLKVNQFLKVFDENRLDFTGYKEIIFIYNIVDCVELSEKDKSQFFAFL